MSRYTATHKNGNKVAYGYDITVGYFYQEYDEDDGELITDEDSLFDGLGHGRLLNRLEDVKDVPASHRSLIAMDLPI